MTRSKPSAWFGDLVVAAFFDGRKQRDREQRRSVYADLVARGDAETRRDEIHDRRRADPPLAPLHWEIVFPEVFDRETSAAVPGDSLGDLPRGGNPGGFDALVGNPPFAGKNTVAAANAAGYPDWLKATHEESHGNADLVAHFFRRAFTLVRDRGTFGLIATNTIAQGDTRSTGLRWICTHGGEIYHARRRLRWPGQAAVVVSVVHVHRGRFFGARRLDNAPTDTITAFLFHRGGHEDPTRLAANAGKSFQGSIVLGMGFTFDDTDKKGVASPLARYRRLTAEDPHNREAIFPYIGGEEVNTSPTHAHHRYVINFRDYPLRREDRGELWATADERQRRDWLRSGMVPVDYPDPVAADWPELLAIVEERVKPDRERVNRKVRRDYWWRFGDRQPALYRAIAGLERVLAISQVTQHVTFARLPADMIYAHRLYVISESSHAAFAVLQSNLHDIWARFFGSSLEDRFMYAAADCLETFPFPDAWEVDSDLEAVGEHYHAFRADLMARHGEGLTRTYNRFHDPHENASEIVTLRRLHAAMDRAVLDAYGWREVPTDCEFLLDQRLLDEEWGARKKPYRYRWPDEVRDEVLGRLLELNARRAARETRAGTIETIPPRQRKTARPTASVPTRGAVDPRPADRRALCGWPDD